MSQATPGRVDGERGFRAAPRGDVPAARRVSPLTDLPSEMVHPPLPGFIAGPAPAHGAALAAATASLLKPVSGRLGERLGRREALILGRGGPWTSQPGPT